MRPSVDLNLCSYSSFTVENITSEPPGAAAANTQITVFRRVGSGASMLP